MKTGIFIRFERDGKWQNLDIADMTTNEFTQFLASPGQQDRIDVWAIGLHKWIVEHVIFDEMGE